MTQVSEPRKKLIEHSIPLEAINKASAREKSVRHGHPSTLHLWWARRPLAACRAVLFAQLVDDPSAWPARFKTDVEQDKERQRLHDVIKAMVEWPKSAAVDQKRFERSIEAARWEIARSVAWGLGEEPPAAKDPSKVLDYLQTKAPPVYDPFCGGGSIPLEAQRLGLRAYGSDLNPVAVLITKALIEFPPKFAGLSPIHPDTRKDKSLIGRDWRGAQGLAEDVRRYGQWMRDEAHKRIGHLYPAVTLPNGENANVIAWLWARTVASPDPVNRGAHVPLVSSFVLSAKAESEAIVVPIKDASAKDGWRFEVRSSGISAQEFASAKNGTKSSRGANFVCVLSAAAIDSEYVKSEGRLGRIGARLMAIVAEGPRGRLYLGPTEEHERIATFSHPSVPELEQPMPQNPRWFSPPDYGLPLYRDLFSPRQLLAVATFSDLVAETRERVLEDAGNRTDLAARPDSNRPLADGGTGACAYADAIATYLAFAVTKLADRATTICTWDPGASGKSSTGSAGRAAGIRNTFGRQAIPMSWDYAEINPLSETVANFQGNNEWIGKVLDNLPASGQSGVSMLDAARNGYPVRPVTISTDPPYYDNIGYADLSDFFFVWSRRALSKIHPDLFRRIVTPKSEELVATPYRHGGRDAAERHFMNGMAKAIGAMRGASTDTSPLVIYYAFKQSEVRSDGLFSPGWAAFLQAVVDAGLQVDGTWPIRTEMATRQVASGTNALAASVVLVCRKRPEDASISSRRDFLRELKPVMLAAILDQQKAGIPLPDRRQAAIGPGIGVFSKYAIVREADDSPMRVATALALINKEIDSALGTGTQEMDAETRFALQWFEQHGYKQLDAGAGAAIAQLQGFDLSEARINASGVFRAKGGNAKLLTREEMHDSALAKYHSPWRPMVDDSLTVWELAQHMARALTVADGGVDAAGRLLAEARIHASEVLLVAERLFELATAKSLNDEAKVWSQLQGSWTEIEAAADRAAEEGVGVVDEQADMFEAG